jgi:chromosome segregation ATPase
LKSSIEVLNETVTDQKRESKMVKLAFAEMEKTVAENEKSLAQLNQATKAKTLEVNQLTKEKTLVLNELALINSTLNDKKKNMQDLESKMAVLIHEH